MKQIYDVHNDVTDPELVANGSIMADASCETFGAPSSYTGITYLEFKNRPENWRMRRLRLQCAYVHSFFQIQVLDWNVTDKIK